MKLVLGALSFVVLSCFLACGGSDTSNQSAGTTGGSAGNGGTGGTGGGTGGTGGGTGGTGGGTGECHSQSDCDGAEFCSAFTLPPLCGGMEDITFDQNCSTDADCADAGVGQICDDMLCAGVHDGAQPALHCRAGCNVAADCGPGFACTAEHRCVAATCAQPAECGSPNFTCTGGACAPKACSTDADCGNFCVNGSCSAVIGHCAAAVP